METLLAISLGIGLSAACGFRVFVPLLVMSVASLSGHLTLAPGFQWIGSYPALVTFSVATFAEIAGYYIPWVDHLLDTIATPAAEPVPEMVAGSHRRRWRGWRRPGDDGSGSRRIYNDNRRARQSLLCHD